jgi:hypothetical protein
MKVKVVPEPKLELTAILPPKTSQILLQTLRPRPMPEGLILAVDFSLPNI